MLEPSFANKTLVRVGATLAAVAVSAGSSLYLSSSITKALHLAAWGVWLGTNTWNSFFVGFTMFKNMPRQVRLP
jgi:hypothetical protein